MLVRAAMSIAIVGAIFILSPARRASDTAALSSVAAQARDTASGLTTTELTASALAASGLATHPATLATARLLSDASERAREMAGSHGADMAPADRTGPHAVIDTLKPSDRRATWRGSLAE